MPNHPRQRTATILICRGLFLLLGVLTVSHLASAQTVNIWNGQNAYAWFMAADPSDPSGCKMVEVSIGPSLNQTKSPPGPGNSYGSVSLFLAQFDNCTGSWIKFFQDFPSLNQG
jgi:hypothetical protein